MLKKKFMNNTIFNIERDTSISNYLNMCKYCAKNISAPVLENGKLIKVIDFKINNKSSKIEIDYDAYSCDSSFFITVDINYCPFCGKNLK